MAGIGLGPILISWTKFTGILLLDSVACIASLGLLVAMKPNLAPVTNTEVKGISHSLFSRSYFSISILLLALPVWLCLGVVNVTEPKLLIDRFRFDPTRISLIYVLTFSSSLVFTLFYPRQLVDKSPIWSVLIGGTAMILSGTMLLFCFHSLAVFPIAVTIGLANAVFNTGITHLIQKNNKIEARTSALLATRLAMQLGLLGASFFITATNFESEHPEQYLLIMIPSIVFFIGGAWRNMKTATRTTALTTLLTLILLPNSKRLALAEIKTEDFVVNVPIKSIPSSLDPAKVVDASSALVQRQLYQPLYDYTDTNNLIPILAKSHSISPDGKTYSLKIDTKRNFHDGTQVNASIVKRSLERAIYRLGQGASWAFGDVDGFSQFVSAPRQGELFGLKIVSDDVLQIKLIRPFSQFLQVLTAPNFVIVFERGESLIGTGNYTVKETSDMTMTLERVKAGETSEAPKKITFILSPSIEKTTQLATDGSIDLFQAADATTAAPRNFQRINFNFLQALILIINTKSENFRNNTQRCSFSNAFKEAVQKEGIGWDSATAGLPYGWDLFEKSAAAEIGIKCAKTTTTVRYVNSAAWFTARQIKSLESSLSKGGCKVHLNEDTPKNIFTDLEKGKFEAALIGFIPDYLDPDAFLTPLLRTGQLYNWARFSNENMDTLLLLSREMSDQESRQAVLKKVFDNLGQQCPIAFLGSQPGVIMFSSKITAPKVSGLGFHMIDLSQLRKK